MADGQDQAAVQQQALEVKESELDDNVASLKAQVEQQHTANSTEAVEAGQNETAILDERKVLFEQFAAVKADLAQVQETASEADALKAQIANSQRDLAAAQEDRLAARTECDAKTKTLRVVLEAEQRKVALVAEQAASCAALVVNRDYLKKQVAAACA